MSPAEELQESAVRFLSPSLADVEQVSHHPEQHLRGADGTVVVCRHLVADEVLALLGCQLLAFTEGIDVDKVVDVLTPAGKQGNKQDLPDVHHRQVQNDTITLRLFRDIKVKLYPLGFWHQRSRKWFGKLTGST